MRKRKPFKVMRKNIPKHNLRKRRRTCGAGTEKDGRHEERELNGIRTCLSFIPPSMSLLSLFLSPPSLFSSVLLSFHFLKFYHLTLTITHFYLE